MPSLTPKQRRELRARAHALHPVVAIGHAGLSPAVLHEIDVALAAHELVKVRVHSDDRDEREAHLAGICEALEAAPVQHLGKLLILWRPAQEPEPQPRPKRERPSGRTGRRRAAPEPAPATGRRQGPPVPSVGARAAQHRRGSARHGAGGKAGSAMPAAGAPRPRPSEAAPPAANARRRLVAGKPSAGGVAAKSSVGGRQPSFGAKRPPSGAKRPPSGAKRPPATAKRGPASGAPSAVRRRRRPTGGR